MCEHVVWILWWFTLMLEPVILGGKHDNKEWDLNWEHCSLGFGDISEGVTYKEFFRVYTVSNSLPRHMNTWQSSRMAKQVRSEFHPITPHSSTRHPFIHPSIHHHNIDNMCPNPQPPFHFSISRPSSFPSFLSWQFTSPPMSAEVSCSSSFPTQISSSRFSPNCHLHPSHIPAQLHFSSYPCSAQFSTVSEQELALASVFSVQTED